jgi:hypothetical protein
VACLVLAATLLAVAARFEWMPLAVGGLVCTYGILVFRSPAGEPLPGLAGLTIGAGLLRACGRALRGLANPVSSRDPASS